MCLVAAQGDPLAGALGIAPPKDNGVPFFWPERRSIWLLYIASHEPRHDGPITDVRLKDFDLSRGSITRIALPVISRSDRSCMSMEAVAWR